MERMELQMEKVETITSVDHIHIYVDEFESTSQVLRNVLNFKFIKEFEVAGKKIQHFELHGAKIFLSLASKEQPAGINHIGINTKKIQKTSESFENEGCEQVNEQMFGDRLLRFFSSPSGITFELLEEKNI